MELLFRFIEQALVLLSQVWSTEDRIRSEVQPVGVAIAHSLDGGTFGEPVILSPSSLDTHAYLLGSTGAGKTNLILKLLEQDVLAERSVVVVDLRGDLIERALGLCTTLGVEPERVVLLDLREHERIVGFNPLRAGAEPFVRALHLVDVLRSEAASWGIQLEETLRNCLLLLAIANRTLPELERLLFDLPFLSECLRKTDDPSVSGFFERYQALSKERQLSFALPVLNKVTPLLATEGLRAVLGSPKPIDLESMLNQPGSVFLVALSVDELHASARMMGALMISALSRTLFSRVKTAEKGRNPVRLYVDEFEAMACSSFEGLIAEGRRFKLSLVLSHQNLSQLPAKLRSAIRNNVGAQLFARCGFEDAREVARDLANAYTAEELTAFEVGEMLFLERGREIRHVKVKEARSSPERDVVTRYRDAILELTGQPREEVLQSLNQCGVKRLSFESVQRPWDTGNPSCN